jgi:hypothetical protein
MNRAVLANYIPVSDLDAAPCLWLGSKILRKPADNRPVPNRIPCADPNGAFDHGVRANDCPSSNHNVRPDDRECANLYVVREHRARFDYGCGVDLHNAPASLKLK